MHTEPPVERYGDHHGEESTERGYRCHAFEAAHAFEDGYFAP